jgi:hypothetical protein
MLSVKGMRRRSGSVAKTRGAISAVGVLVEVERLAERRVLLRPSKERHLLYAGISIAFAHRVEDGLRVDPLVDVQRDGRHLEAGVLGLAGPDQLRVEIGSYW